MQRIKIDLPDSFAFSTTLFIRVTDLNYGGHVGNDTFLSLLQEARQQFLLSYGYTELIFEALGLIMADVQIEFKKELNYGDQLKISVAALHPDKLGFDLYYKLEVVSTEGIQLAGKAKTGMLCYDYTAKKKTPIPKAAMEKLFPDTPAFLSL